MRTEPSLYCIVHHKNKKIKIIQYNHFRIIPSTILNFTRNEILALKTRPSPNCLKIILILFLALELGSIIFSLYKLSEDDAHDLLLEQAGDPPVRLMANQLMDELHPHLTGLPHRFSLLSVHGRSSTPPQTRFRRKAIVVSGADRDPSPREEVLRPPGKVVAGEIWWSCAFRRQRGNRIPTHAGDHVVQWRRICGCGVGSRDWLLGLPEWG